MTWYSFANRKLITAMIALTAGCTVDAEPDVASIAERIQGGQEERGFVGVGVIRMNGGTECTGSLISSRFVLTAGHCIFDPKTTSYSFVMHDSSGHEHVFGVASSYPHPLWTGGDDYDQRVIELDQEVDLASVPGLELVSYQRETLPLMDTECTAVGYGYYTDEKKVQHEGKKRSCTELVTSADDMHIHVHWKTGIIDHLDSGGPLLCSGSIAGVVRKHYDLSDGGVQQDALYTTVDAPWVKSILDDPSSHGRDPRRMDVDCDDYPIACVEHEGELSLRSCDQFGLQYQSCGELRCTEYEDRTLGRWAVCGDPPQ